MRGDGADANASTSGLKLPALAVLRRDSQGGVTPGESVSAEDWTRFGANDPALDPGGDGAKARDDAERKDEAHHSNQTLRF